MAASALVPWEYGSVVWLTVQAWSRMDGYFGAGKVPQIGSSESIVKMTEMEQAWGKTLTIDVAKMNRQRNITL